MTSWTTQPSIYLGTLRVDEPVVLLTNLLITAVCWFAFFRLRKLRRTSRAQRYYRLYFLAMGAATLLGGFLGHGFFYALGMSWKLPGWTVSMIGVTMFSLASIETTKPLIAPNTAQFFLSFNMMEFFVCLVVAFITVDFTHVQFHSTYNLIGVVVPFHIYNYLKTRDKGSLVIVSAVAVISMTAVVFVNKISPGIWFNHLDLSHVFMATGTYIFYRGVVLLKD